MEYYNYLNKNKSNILIYSIIGVVTSFFYDKIKHYIKKKYLIKSEHNNFDNKNTDKSSTKNIVENNNSSYLDKNNEAILLREQLKRNYEFFNDESMENIKKSFVCVVGIGGVGSHTVMTLIRSGVQKIRVIDYDIVTLSSLNRHAFALRGDVGKLKVRVVKEYASKVFPLTTVEDIDDAITPETKDKYLEGVDYVIDCIDDLDNKCFLLKYCVDKKLKVISSMGAGARMNPFLTRMADLNQIKGEKLAKRLRYAYKKKFNENIPNGIKCVFSIEVPKRGLSELEEHQKEDKQAFIVNDNERLRTLPVFASIPAIFGQSLAAVCLCDLAGETEFAQYDEAREEEEKQEDFVGEYSLKKLIQELKEQVNNDEM
jgi:tRNA A37 threonylcarbamoyladenosine dehydratase